jgi:ZIP family zinc transporter
MNNILFAFSLSLLAGLSTGIGSALAFFTKKTNTKFLSLSLGFSAGVMIYVSMVEIFVNAKDSLTSEIGIKAGSWLTVISFFCGMLLIYLIDTFIPSEESTAAAYNIKYSTGYSDIKLLRIGILTALAIAIHNFPEGIATFISGIHNPSIAVPIAVAIAIHNIPEGISVSVPIYYATGDRKKAFLYSFISGLSEPLGAVIGYLILMPFINNLTFGIIFAAVAGIMVFISLNELLPAARDYGDDNLYIYGLIGGMAVMAISLLLFL